MRKWLVLSITMQPAAAARGACTAETAAPGLNRPMSQPVKSKRVEVLNLEDTLSPNETSGAGRPAGRERRRLRETGKLRSARVFSISRPTAPVAPTTATL